MAGDFTNCWDQEVLNLFPTGGSIGEGSWKMMACLPNIKNEIGISKYGPNILKYVLLGDSSSNERAITIIHAEVWGESGI